MESRINLSSKTHIILFLKNLPHITLSKHKMKTLSCKWKKDRKSSDKLQIHKSLKKFTQTKLQMTRWSYKLSKNKY